MIPYFHTPDLSIKDHPADADHHGPVRSLTITTDQPLYGVLHATGGVSSLDWLSTARGSQVSCHRLISKLGVLYKLLDDKLTPWTQGPAHVGMYDGSHLNINSRCLSIELENLNNGFDVYPEPQVKATAWQIAEWWGMYGAFPIVAHAWIQKDKTDPAGFPWPLFYTFLFERIRTVV